MKLTVRKLLLPTLLSCSNNLGIVVQGFSSSSGRSMHSTSFLQRTALPPPTTRTMTVTRSNPFEHDISLLKRSKSSTMTPSSGAAALRTTSSSSSLSMRSNDNDTMNGISDRILSCLPYLLPIVEGDRWGRFIYTRFPILGMVDSIVVGPFKTIYTSIPFVGFGCFILLTVLSRNTNISRSIRFNMQQAILIDIALIFPSLLGQVGGSIVPRVLVEPGSNFVYYFLFFSVGYSIVSNLILGKQPNQIPWISDAAEQQIGPF